VGPNQLAWPRIGCAVPRRYGKAVRRNQLRRLIKEAFRLEKGNLPPGYDIVVSPARGLDTPTLDAVRASLVNLVSKVVRRLEKTRPPGGDTA
jgi:ribonuclease P protein component